MQQEGKADFMSVHWKAVLIASSGAFVLSFLTGLVSGVAFGVLLLRALLFAALFATGTAASIYSMKRWLPELLSDETDSGLGHRIDLTVGDEDGDSEEEHVRRENDVSDRQVSSVFDDSMIEEVEESSAVGTDPTGHTAAAAPANAESSEDDEELPALDGFAGSFETVGTDAERAISSEGSSSNAVDEYGMDTKSMAEALRTVLKRDE